MRLQAPEPADCWVWMMTKTVTIAKECPIIAPSPDMFSSHSALADHSAQIVFH